MLTDHLGDAMKRTNLAIRATTKEAFQGLKNIHSSGAEETIRDTLEEAETIRKKRQKHTSETKVKGLLPRKARRTEYKQ